MLKIRLRRMGSRHRPFYRVVVGDSRRTPQASALEEIGYYDPRKKPAVLNIDLARADHWVSQGARPSPTVERLIEKVRKGPETPAAEAEAPAAEKPAAEKPAAEKPAAEKPAAEKPAAEKPAAEKPAAEKPAAEKPAAEKPAAEKPAAEKPAAEKPAAEAEGK